MGKSQSKTSAKAVQVSRTGRMHTSGVLALALLAFLGSKYIQVDAIPKRAIEVIVQRVLDTTASYAEHSE